MPRPPISNPPLHSWASTSFDGRRESLHASTRGVPSCGALRSVLRVLAASPQPSPAEQVHERSHRRQQYHRTARRTGRSVPLLWLLLRAGLAAMRSTCWGLPHRLDPPTANHPRVRQRRYQPDRPGSRPARSLSLFDLGYFCLDRFQYLTRSGAFWISRRSMARRSSTPRASPCRCCNTCGSRQGRDRSTCRSCWA